MSNELQLPKTFYCLNYDGTLRTNRTQIVFSPSQRIEKTETAFGDQRDFRDIIEINFVRGVYEAHDEDAAARLAIYTSGGTLRGKYYPPNNFGFTITDIDPNVYLQSKESVKEVEVIRTQYPMSSLDLMNAKLLESLLINHGIELAGVSPTKASYIDLLDKNGLVSK